MPRSLGGTMSDVTVMTPQEAAERLNVDPEVLLNMARHGRIPFTKQPGNPRVIMFDEEQINEYLERLKTVKHYGSR